MSYATNIQWRNEGRKLQSKEQMEPLITGIKEGANGASSNETLNEGMELKLWRMEGSNEGTELQAMKGWSFKQRKKERTKEGAMKNNNILVIFEQWRNLQVNEAMEQWTINEWKNAASSNERN